MMKYHIIIEAYNLKTHSRQFNSPFRIQIHLFFFIMIITINLYHQLFLQTYEVNYVISDNMLAIKLYPQLLP